jgi:hypothetical protein
MLDGSAALVAALLVEAHARKSRHQLQAREALGARLGLTALEDGAPEPPTGVFGSHEAGTDAGSLGARVERRFIALRARIAAKERTTATPATARRQLSRAALDDEVGAVTDQRGVYTEGALECCLDLRRRIVARSELTYGAGDQLTQSRLVVESGNTQPVARRCLRALQDSSSTLPPMAAVLMVRVRSLAKRRR